MPARVGPEPPSLLCSFFSSTPLSHSEGCASKTSSASKPSSHLRRRRRCFRASLAFRPLAARSLEQEWRKGEMVLWELTAITAYFLGLKRTYRLALRIQRRLIGPNHPRTRDFVYRRTRDVFGVAVSVHKNIQQRDLEVGRNLGNTILRWLDRMKPSAEIRPHPPGPPNGSSERFRNLSSTNRSAGAQKTASKTSPHDSSGKMLFSRLNLRPKSFPILPTMMQPNRINAGSQCRHISYSPLPSLIMKRKLLTEGVFRKDIAQLMV